MPTYSQDSSKKKREKKKKKWSSMILAILKYPKNKITRNDAN